MADDSSSKRDFFISRAGSDKDVAIAVRSILQTAGYTTWLQDDDFDQASFMARMAQGWSSGARLVSLLSRAYQQSEHCKKEYEVALKDDPRNLRGQVIVLRIENYMPIEHLADLAFTDLVPLLHKADDLTRAVLGAVGVRDRKEADFAALFRRSGTQVLHPEVRPVPDFTGRDAELAAIETALWNAGGRAALTGSTAAAVKGLGGVGKSVLAQEYAWRNRDRYHGIWWIRAERNETLLDDLIELGAHFVPSLREVPDRHQAAQTALTQIAQAETEKPWLLVYDNVEEPRHIERLTPRTGAHVLITTRWGDWESIAAPVKVGVFAPDVAANFLLESTRRSDREGALKLAAALGHLPLALDHAAAYCRRTGINFATYDQLAADLIRKAPKGVDYDTPVFATFSLAIDKASEAFPEAQKLMGVCAFLAPDRIPLGIFATDVLSEIERGEAVAALQEVSLATLEMLDDGSPSLSMHRLVQAVMRGRLKEMGEYENGAGLATSLLSDAFPRAAQEVGQWAASARLLPHVLAVFPFAPTSGENAEKSALLFNEAAMYLYGRAQYAEALPLCERSLIIRESTLEPDDSRVGTTLSNLALLYRGHGRYADAEPLQKRALAIYEKAYGPEHPRVATVLGNLARLYCDMGRYDESEPHQKRVLDICEKTVGVEHRQVAWALAGLAELYQYQGRYADAEPHRQRALAIYEKATGPDHPNVAEALTGLATLYQSQGHYAEAEPYLKRVLEICKKIFGPEHLRAGMALEDLGALYRDQGRHAEAEPLLKQALSVQENALGPEHPTVARSLGSLAWMYWVQDRHAEAETLFLRAMSIEEHVLGQDHPSVAATLSSLASVYRDQGRYTEAEPYLRRALTIYEETLGPDHPSVGLALDSLGKLYRSQHLYADAEVHLNRALTIQEKALGPHHPELANTLADLALLYEDQGHYDKAESLHQRAVAICDAALGAVHPNTKIIRANFEAFAGRKLASTAPREQAKAAPASLLARLFGRK